jgi:hypothetical protein
VSRCAKEGDDSVRHACLDHALRDGGLLPRSSPAVATPAPPPAPVPGAPTRLTTPRLADSSASPQPDRATVRLTGVIVLGDGARVLATQDGSIWRESKGGPRVPDTLVKGQIIIIRRQPSGDDFTCEPVGLTAFNCYPMH